MKSPAEPAIGGTLRLGACLVDLTFAGREGRDESKLWPTFNLCEVLTQRSGVAPEPPLIEGAQTPKLGTWLEGKLAMELLVLLIVWLLRLPDKVEDVLLRTPPAVHAALDKDAIGL